MRKPSFRSVLCLALSFAAIPGVWAQTLTFNKVVSTDTAAPGHDGKFVNFDGGSAVSNGTVVFTGIYVVDNKAAQGIFTGKADGSTPVTVADAGMAVPGRTGATFGLVENPVIDGGTIAFFGSYPDTTQPPIQPGQYPDAEGVFTTGVGSANIAVLRPSGAAPDGGDFDSPDAISGGTVAIGLGSSISSGAVGSGTTTAIVTAPQSVATGLNEKFTGLTNASVSGQSVVFGGNTLDHSGLFLATAGVVGNEVKLLDDTTISPEGTTFEEFEGTAISGTTVAFVALYKGTSRTNEGVYTTSTTAPAPVLIADTKTLVPGLTGTNTGANFTSFVKVPVIVGGTVVFEAFYGGGEGIFMWNKGVLTKVVTTDDTLFGGTSADVFLGAGGYDGKDITFQYTLSNGERGIAVTTVGGSGGGASSVGVAAEISIVPANGSGGPGKFTVTRTGDLSAKATVKYAVKGSAQAGVDYEKLSGKLKLKPGKASATVEVVPLGAGDRGKRIVKLVILPGSGYTVGETPAAKIKLVSAR